LALFDKKMHDPVSAVARVVDNDGLKSMPGKAVHCPLDLMVEAEGMAAYMVHVTVRPKTGKWPEINQLLPVIIDRSNPSRVEIVWDQIPSLLDKVQMRTAGRLAAAQHAVADGSSSVVPVAPDPLDPVDRIARLADLRDRGALTQAEFDVQKKRILGE
jgi:Short C-terminal domain